MWDGANPQSSARRRGCFGCRASPFGVALYSRLEAAHEARGRSSPSRVTIADAGGRRAFPLLPRPGIDRTAKFPQFAAKARLRALKVKSAYLDGELCGVRPGGVTSFELMQQASDRGGAGLVYFVFDLLDLDGEDLAALPLLDRKTRLAALLEKPPDGIAFSAHETCDGEAFRRAACRHGLEGVVSKRVDRRYLPDDRSAWIKSKCLNRGEFVIVGWSDPEGSRPFLGSLLLAYHDDDGRLLYAGRVGTGMSQKTLALLHRRLAPLAVPKCRSPFRRRAKPASAAGSSSRRCIGSARSWSPRSPI